MLGTKSTHTYGEGERRARERLAAKRKANRAIPTVDIPTRQRLRRETILRERQIITVAKREVPKDIKGGSAIIRSVGDIERVLG